MIIELFYGLLRNLPMIVRISINEFMFSCGYIDYCYCC